MFKKVALGAGVVLGLAVLAGVFWVLTHPPASPSEQALKLLGGSTVWLHQAMDAAQVGDIQTARARFGDFEEIWEQVESAVAGTSPESYRTIEERINAVREAFERGVPPARLAAAIEELDEGIDLYLTKAATASGKPARAVARIESVVELVADARARLAAGDTAGALARVRDFQAEWPFVEAQVKARSPEAYRLVENELGIALSALNRSGSDRQAQEALTSIENALRSLTARESEYGPIDAAVILLREGLEAVLVITALLAFLNRSGHSDKAAWVWGGGLAGVLASVAAGLAANLALTGVAAATDPEVVEGVTALVAATLLVYVSYWLHSKSSLRAWQRYIQGTTSRALARGSLFGLGLIAFLAVFREGVETVIFYLGIAPAISSTSLLLGLGLGTGLLAGISAAIFLLGLRLPLRPFFLAASLLIYFLAFKFIGTGIHSLQVAGLLGVSVLDYLPAIDWLGIFPTWETALAQLALLLGALVVLVLEWRPRPGLA
jgi:high-affinity iron transporter